MYRVGEAAPSSGGCYNALRGEHVSNNEFQRCSSWEEAGPVYENGQWSSPCVDEVRCCRIRAAEVQAGQSLALGWHCGRRWIAGRAEVAILRLCDSERRETTHGDLGCATATQHISQGTPQKRSIARHSTFVLYRGPGLDLVDDIGESTLREFLPDTRGHVDTPPNDSDHRHAAAYEAWFARGTSCPANARKYQGNSSSYTLVKNSGSP